MPRKKRLTHEERFVELTNKNVPYESFIEHYQWLGRAYKYQQANPYDRPLYIFGMDKSGEGKNYNDAKWWVLASIPAFTDYIVSLDPYKRHGNCLTTMQGPLFGFMDWEYDIAINPSRDISAMLDTLFTCYNETWQHVFPNSDVTITRDSFLVLTSSNDVKVSFHVHGPFNHAFASTADLRVFMKEMMRIINDKYMDILMVVKYSVERKENVQWCFIDKMVYRHHKPVCCLHISTYNLVSNV
jgi:hypothetical protein